MRIVKTSCYVVSLLLVLTLGVAAQMISMPWGIAFTQVVCILAPAVAYVRLRIRLDHAARILQA